MLHHFSLVMKQERKIELICRWLSFLCFLFDKDVSNFHFSSLTGKLVAIAVIDEKVSTEASFRYQLFFLFVFIWTPTHRYTAMTTQRMAWQLKRFLPKKHVLKSNLLNMNSPCIFSQVKESHTESFNWVQGRVLQVKVSFMMTEYCVVNSFQRKADKAHSKCCWMMS